jgi:hypothetical protein
MIIKQLISSHEKTVLVIFNEFSNEKIILNSIYIGLKITKQQTCTTPCEGIF